MQTGRNLHDLAAGSLNSNTIYPQNAANPVRFAQRLQQQTANTVLQSASTFSQPDTRSNHSKTTSEDEQAYGQRVKLNSAAPENLVVSPAVSLASLAAQEYDRQRKQQFLNSGCVQSNALVTLNSNLANRLSKANLRAAANFNSALEFNILLPSITTLSLLSHQLAYGQLQSWELNLQCSEEKRQERDLFSINPLPAYGQDYYTLGVTELYPITCERQRISLGQNLFLHLPLTLANIVSVAVFPMPRKMMKQCNAKHIDRDEIIPVYWFKTSAPHGYVPGLSFFFVVGPEALTDSVCVPEKCALESHALPCNAQRFVVIDTTHCDAACLGAGGSEHEHCFLALRCNCDGPQQARVFAPFDDIEFKKYGSDSPLIVVKDLDQRLSVQLVSLYHNRQCDVDQAHCIYVCYAKDQAYAYVPPPTTPDQLTVLANGTARRAQLVSNAQMCNACSSVSFKYDASIDHFMITLGSSCTYERSLFGDSEQGTASLNFPLTRSAMVATETSPALQRSYIERVLHEFFWFNVRWGINDCFFVRFECDEKSTRKITIPPGVYTARHLASLIQQCLNSAYATERKELKSSKHCNSVLAYQFRVTHRLYPTDQLLRARVELEQSGSNSFNFFASTSKITPYTSMTFCFRIEALESTQLFSLRFADCPASQEFAKLIDFEPQYCYQLRTMYVGRALAPIYSGSDMRARQCAEQIEKCAPLNGPCPRRTYEVSVSTAMGQTAISLEQRIQRPFRVKKVASSSNDCCQGPLTVSICVPSDCECDPPIQVCAGDVLIASRTNPLCRTWCGVDQGDCVYDCTEGEVLVPILFECGQDQFTLAFDPFPAPLLELQGKESARDRAAHLSRAETFWLWSMPVGFNLHLHGASPLQQASSVNYTDAEKSKLVPVAAQSTPVTRYLGFSTPETRTGAFIYTSDTLPTSIIDENILVVVPELAPAASSNNRHTLYANTSPFDRLLQQVYAQLVLDRQRKAYLAGPDIVANPLAICREICIDACINGISPLPSITIILLRPDGSPYYLNGGQYVFTFEMAFVQK